MERFNIIENDIKMNDDKTVGIIQFPHLLLSDVNDDVILKIFGISENKTNIESDGKIETDKIVVFKINEIDKNEVWDNDEEVHISKKCLDLAFDVSDSKKVMCHKSGKGKNLCYIVNNESEDIIIIAGLEVKKINVKECKLMDLYKPDLMSFF